ERMIFTRFSDPQDKEIIKHGIVDFRIAVARVQSPSRGGIKESHISFKSISGGTQYHAMESVGNLIGTHSKHFGGRNSYVNIANVPFQVSLPRAATLGISKSYVRYGEYYRMLFSSCL